MYRYAVLLEHCDDEDGYVVSVPALPGCFTKGDTLNEALSNAREAIQCHISGLLPDNDAVPIETRPPFLVSIEVALDDA